MNIPGINEHVAIDDLNRLNDALRKSGTVGHQDPSGLTSGAGSLSPLVPQSLENVLASATYSMQAIQLWRNIPKTQVGQTVHEYNVITDHGLDLSPFMAEGKVPAMNRSTYDRRFVRIKYMAEMREISDVASTINPLAGPNPTALAEETERGTLRLMQKVERELWHGDESINALGFDGIIKQISAEEEAVTDLRDKATPEALQDIIASVYAAPRYGAPDCIYVEPKVHASLIKQTNDQGRFNTISQSDGSYTFGAGDLKIMGPYGPVPVKAAPFLFNSWEAPAKGSETPNAPDLDSQAPIAAAAGQNNDSKFGAADAGDYFYKVVAVSNAGGYSAPVATANAIAVAEGDRVTVSVKPKAGSGAEFFRIYRSDKGGAASTCKLIGQVKANADQAVDFIDDNQNIPGTSSIVMVKHSSDIMRFARLLDFIRRPLAEVATTRPFLLMLFGAPIVAVPQKCQVIRNVKLA